MKRSSEKFLERLRKKVAPLCGNKLQVPPYIDNREEATSIMRHYLEGEEPAMIARYGHVELTAIVNYLGTRNENNHSYWKYIKGDIDKWWWDSHMFEQMQNNAGFFPVSENAISKYAQLTIEDSALVDVLGCWLPEETRVEAYLPKDYKRIRLRYLEPDYWTENASGEWTQCLKDKKVLLVHPFTKTIKLQYQKRKKLFKDSSLIPDFELQTVQAVQSIGGGNKDFDSWFDALRYMEDEIDKQTYDIAIIGCGAYGFNLAAHVKRTGHKAIHLGGATQLLFGIIGNRWESRDDFRQLINDFWVRPSMEERPATASQVEGACYW